MRQTDIDKHLATFDRLLASLPNTKPAQMSATLEAIQKSAEVNKQLFSELQRTVATAQAEASQLTTEKSDLQSKLHSAEKSLQAALKSESDVRERVTQLVTESTAAKLELENTRKANDQIEKERAKLEKVVAEMKATFDLPKDTKTGATAPRSVPVKSVVEAFRDTVAGIAAREDMPLEVEDFHVELKGGVDVVGGVGFMPVSGDQLTPESVSTIRFTLRPSAKIKILEE
jgi:regulator of replication initiation timing